MFYNPFLALVEKGIQWAKRFGGKIYWVWVLIVGVGVLVSFLLWKQSNQAWKYLVITTLIIWIIGMPFVYIHEKNKKRL